MRTVDFYIDQAKEKSGIKTDRKLGISMGLSPAAISDFRTKRSWPADDTIQKLAELAGIPPEQALLELNAWRSTGETQRIYKELIKKLNGVLTVLIIVFMCLSQRAFASVTLEKNIKPLIIQKYTLSHNLRRLWRGLKGWFQSFFTPSLYPA